MSQNLARLCALLVEDVYGPFFSKIFSTLTAFGRLSATHIAQKCRLPLRQIRCGLGLLVQLRLVYHHTTLEGRTTYEANMNNAYNLIRTGRIVQVISKIFGNRAAQVIRKLLSMGHATVGRLEMEFNPGMDVEPPPRRNGEPTMVQNSHAGAENHSGSQVGFSVRKILRRLALEGFILEVRQASFQTWSDARHDAETFVRAFQPLSIPKGKKGQQELDERIKQEVRKRTDPNILPASTAYMPQSSKRRIESDEELPAAKRTKRANIRAGEEGFHSLHSCPGNPDDLDDDVVICINFEKAVAALRNECLAQNVAKKSGRRASQVFGAALLQVGGQHNEFSNSRTVGDQVTTTGQYFSLDMDRLLLDVNSSDVHVPDRAQRWPAKIHSSDRQNQYLVPQRNGYVNGDSHHDNAIRLTPDFIDRQLKIVAEGPAALIKYVSSIGKWTVDLRQLASHLRDAEISELVSNRLGATAMRIVRILHDKGKIDEKSLQEIGLLSAKDLRQALAKLKSQGFIELQEVPREPQRQPNRTIYLWFYDPCRVQSVLLEDLCKAMVKIVQRIKFERRKIRSTLEKVERSDVKGNEERLLAPGELNVLTQWRRRERWLLAELDRLDGTVAMLRDV